MFEINNENRPLAGKGGLFYICHWSWLKICPRE
jgi:hypothetical protein